jgi:hypothetical protein
MHSRPAAPAAIAILALTALGCGEDATSPAEPVTRALVTSAATTIA